MNEAPRMGLRPQGDAKGLVNTKAFDVDVANTVPLGKGSPVYLVAGKVRGLANAYSSAGLIAGSVVRICTTANKSVGGCPAATAGYRVEIAYERDQRYEITVDNTAFAEDGSDVGKMYDLSDETLTVVADEMTVGGFSTRQLKGASEAASAKQIIAGTKTGLINNVGGLANTEIFCTINPANHQQV